MIIEIFNAEGEYLRTIEGDEAQCIANVSSEETYVEEQVARSVSIINESAYLKNLKIDRINNIKVTTSWGKTFDGDEQSQLRMKKKIDALSASFEEPLEWKLADDTTVASATLNSSLWEQTVEWKLADNTIALITLLELREAFALADAAMSAIWLEE